MRSTSSRGKANESPEDRLWGEKCVCVCACAGVGYGGWGVGSIFDLELGE